MSGTNFAVREFVVTRRWSPELDGRDVKERWRPVATPGPPRRRGGARWRRVSCPLRHAVWPAAGGRSVES